MKNKKTQHQNNNKKTPTNKNPHKPKQTKKKKNTPKNLKNQTKPNKKRWKIIWLLQCNRTALPSSILHPRLSAANPTHSSFISESEAAKQLPNDLWLLDEYLWQATHTSTTTKSFPSNENVSASNESFTSLQDVSRV